MACRPWAADKKYSNDDKIRKSAAPQALDLGFSLFVGLEAILDDASDNCCWGTLMIIHLQTLHFTTRVPAISAE